MKQEPVVHVRVPRELHKAALVCARGEDRSLQSLIVSALRYRVRPKAYPITLGTTGVGGSGITTVSYGVAPAPKAKRRGK